jgi:hypothetical protein
MVTGRRERRMAVRLASERAAVPGAADQEAPGQAGWLPGTAGPGADPLPEDVALRTVPAVAGDDDDPAEIFDDPAASDFYADAFEILE